MRRLAVAAFVLLAAASGRAQSPGDFDGDGDLNAADNCAYASNANQLDSTVPPDGVGDACTCGDTNQTGSANVVDWAVLARALAGLGPGVADPAKCSVVGGSMDCDAADAARRRAGGG